MLQATPEPAPDNVDDRERARFEALAHLWWDPAGPMWPLHRLNRLRVGYLTERVPALLGRSPSPERPWAGLEVLDVGCGGGLLGESLAGLGARVHGIDVARRNLEVARRHAARSGLDIRYEETTVEALAARAGPRYDVVLALEVVEHVPDPASFLRAAGGLVRDGGLLGVATINRTARSFLLAIVGAEHVLRWLPRGTHQWRRFPRPREVESLLARDGLEVVERAGVRVNPFTRRFALTASLAVNYMLLARRGAAPATP